MASTTDPRKLLDAVAASGVPDYGEGWINVAHYDDIEVHVFGMGAGDEVDIELSNEDDPPSNPANETTLTGAGPHYHVVSGNPVRLRTGFVTDGGNNSNVTAIVHLRKRN